MELLHCLIKSNKENRRNLIAEYVVDKTTFDRLSSVSKPVVGYVFIVYKFKKIVNININV